MCFEYEDSTWPGHLLAIMGPGASSLPFWKYGAHCQGPVQGKLAKRMSMVLEIV